MLTCDPCRNPLEDPIVIELDGPDGNAWELMAYATSAGRFFGYTKKECEDLRMKMMSSDYYDMIATMLLEFPDTFHINTHKEDVFYEIEKRYEAMKPEYVGVTL